MTSSETYLPFIDDPAHIAELDRQRFVVLRAPITIATAYDQVRSQVRQHLQGHPVSYPARAHVTLCGFASGTPLVAVQTLVRGWAQTLSEVRIEVECVSSFPAPFKIVIVQVRKLPALYAALADLRARADTAELAVSTVMPVERWTFHMSVAYCSKLSLPAWDAVSGFSHRLEVGSASETVEHAEIVAFDDGREYCGGVVRFGRPAI